MSESFFCGKCKNKYASKQNWSLHFEHQKVKSSDSAIKVPNICFNTPKSERVFEKTLDKAVERYNILIKQQQTSKRLFSFSSNEISTNKRKKIDSNGGGDKSKPSTSTQNFVNIAEVNEIVTHQPSSIQKKIFPESQRPSPQKEILQEAEEVILSQPKSIQEPVFSTNSNVTQSETDLGKIMEKLSVQDKLLTEIHKEVCKKTSHSSDSKSTLIKKDTSHVKDNNLNDKSFKNCMSLLMDSKSIDDIMSNDLMKVFEIDSNTPESVMHIPQPLESIIDQYDTEMPEVDDDHDDDIQDNELEDSNSAHKIYCNACKASFNVKDTTFAISPGDNHPRWFINLKRALRRHLKRLKHHQKAATYQFINESQLKTVENIEKLCSNLLYFIIKTNSAWIMYPVLLAVIFRSGLQVGNLNHSVYACERMVDLIDTEMKAQSRKWFNSQKSVTLTADIGTILGLSMLVVLLESESDDSVRFIGVNLINSKEGPYCANQIFDILTSDKFLALET